MAQRDTNRSSRIRPDASDIRSDLLGEALDRRTWGDLVARVTWEEHPDARSMLAAESAAIRAECPALNKAGVG